MWYPRLMPRLLANRELPLPRFWIPFAPDNNHDAPHTLFLNDGILPDPEDSYGKVANRSLTTLAIIAQKRCFALLGQPGLGKSITVKQWVDDMGSRALPGDLVVLLRSVELASEDDIRRDTIETPQWREARMRDGEITLVLDGLDEALQRLPVLLHRLRKCLEDEPVARTRLALVSRVADWRESRADELFALWPEHERGGAFELCPLRWKDVRLAATESGVNADAFTRAVCERRVGWMAGRPKLLMMLIEEFQRFRRLPDNRRELFARAARRMSDEHDPERHEIIAGSGRPVVPVERAHAVVARISAAMLLCGKSRVLMDSRIPPDGADLPLAELIGGAEPLGADSFDVDERHVRAALDTAHFVANGPARIGFDHQSMTEFMTAEYLSRCTAPQLRSLLTQRVDGADFLLPQFREISAWLASHHREFRADVLAHEPRLLIEADAVELDEPARREAVAALLAQMDREEAFDVDESESFLRSLRPAPLARQLRPWIVDETRNVVVRRTAIRLAGIARCRALRDDLWKLLAEPQQTSIHSSIIDALQRMGTPADRANFLRALRGEFGLDPQDEMKGAALKFLVPRHLPVRDVLDYLTPRADDFFGNYWIALEYDLPRAIRVADVLPILERTTRLGKNGGFVGALLPVTKAALKLAFPHFGNSRVCEASIRLLAELAGQSSWEGAWASVRPDGLSSKEEAMLRLAVLESFVVRARGQFRAFVQFGLWPHPDDLGWVLEKVRAAREPQRSLWADLTCQLLFRGLPEKLRAQFLRTYRSVKALREKLPKSRRFDLIETIERRARAVQRRHELWERRSKRRTAAREVGKLTIGNILEQLHAGRAGWWGYFVRVLIRSHSESPQTELQNKPRAYAIATWDGWKELTAADRKIALNMAAEFLRAAPVPIREFGKLFSIDESAVLAIVLLRSRLSRDPKLREIVRGKWTPAVLHGLYNGEPELDAATKFVCALDRRACLAWCSEELNYEQQKGLRVFKPPTFQTLLGHRLHECRDSFRAGSRADAACSPLRVHAAARCRTKRRAGTLAQAPPPRDPAEVWKVRAHDRIHRLVRSAG